MKPSFYFFFLIPFYCIQPVQVIAQLPPWENFIPLQDYRVLEWNDVVEYKGRLFIGGHFINRYTSDKGGVLVWNGSTLELFNNIPQIGRDSYVNWFYHDKAKNILYVNFRYAVYEGLPGQSGSPKQRRCIATYNGYEWKNWFDYSSDTTINSIYSLVKYKERLYSIIEKKHKVCGTHKGRVHLFNGQTFIPYPISFYDSMDCAYYGRMIADSTYLYLGGNVSVVDTSYDPPNWYLTKYITETSYCDSTGRCFRMGDLGVNCATRDLEFHNDTLYQCGSEYLIPQSYNPQKFVNRWTGTEWLPIGSPTFAAATDLLSYNGTLYAGGSQHGKSAAIMKKVGLNTWVPLNDEVFESISVVMKLVAYKGYLYFIGDVDSIIGKQRMNKSARIKLNETSPPPTQTPIARNDQTTVHQDSSVTVNILDNDDQKGCQQTKLKIITAPAHGSGAIITSNQWASYNPKNTFAGKDSMQYELCNENNRCDSAWVLIAVEGKTDTTDTTHTSTTGVFGHRLRIYPNPVTDRCVIRFDKGALERVEIYSAIGQKLKMFSLSGISNFMEINLADLPQGYYLLHALLKDETFITVPLVKPY